MGIILLVDDDPDFCLLLESILDDKKFTVHSVYNLETARQKLIEIRPGIILLDNHLPDGKGIDFLEQIFEFDPLIRVIMVSGETTPRLKLRALEQGVTEFIPKPCSFKQITDAVEAMR